MVTAKAFLLMVALSAASDTELLCFGSRWCEPCRQMQPVLARLASEGYRLTQVDVEQQSEMARRFGVQGVPAFILVRAGEPLRRIDGATSYEALRRLVQDGSSVPREPLARGQTPGRLAQFSQSMWGALSGEAEADKEAPNRGTPPQLEAVADHRLPGPAARAAQVSYDESPAAPPATVDPSGQAGSDAPWAAAQERALAATVRLRIDDDSGQSYGTGTIVHVHQGEGLVLTCAHIFRSSQGRGPISVELFTGAQPAVSPGKLLSHDYQTDVALITFRTPGNLQPVQVAGPEYQPTKDEGVFTVGCDQGQAPKVKPGNILAINRYLGPANLVVSGRPIDGRSGGGLFAADGRLIGVCNAADPQEDEGLYAALPRVYQELQRNRLQFVFQTPATGNSTGPAVAAAAPATRLADAGSLASPRQVAPTSRNPPLVPVTQTENVRSGPNSLPAVTPVTPPAEADAAVGERADGDAMEIVCVIRTPGENGGRSRVVVFDRPSPELLEALSREYQRQAQRDTALRR